MYGRLCTLGTLAFLVASSLEAAALTESGTVGNVYFTVYAPDWTWQKQNVNVLFVLTNQAATPQDATVALELPQGKETHFKTPSPTESTAHIPSGETVRQALTNVFACDGVPLQTYDFSVSVRCGDSVARMAYPLSTIRGAAVSSAQWALFLPAIVALVWSLLFAVVMSRTAERHAWLTPSKPTAISEEREAWIDQTPT